MQISHQAEYQARHPNSVLVEAEFPSCASALNALFGRRVWEGDYEVQAVSDEEVILDTEEDVKQFRAGKKENYAPLWRAPEENFRGPFSLWRETLPVTANREALNIIRQLKGLPLLKEGAPETEPTTYTAYILVCEMGRLLDGDLQVLTRIADRHNLSLGVEALGGNVLVQLAFVR